MGITFTVYSDGQGIDRAWPFDIIPRIIEAAEWRRIERGLKQRLRRDQPVHRRPVPRPADRRRRGVPRRAARRLGQLPARVRRRRTRSSACGRTSAAATWCATPTARCTCSRTTCACPAGVSYMLENRAISKRVFADLFAQQSILPVDSYTDELNRMLVSIAPDGVSQPDHRGADARHLQLRVLRALVPRAADGCGARRGCRPGRRRRRLRVHAHASAAASACTSSTGASTTCSSTPRCSGPTASLGVPRPDAGVAGGQRGDRQRAGRRRRRRQGRVRVDARHHPLLPRRRSRSSRTCRRTAASTRTSGRT